MPEDFPVFKPTDYDLKKFMNEPFVRYLLVKANQMGAPELATVAETIRQAYWAHLRQLPVVRLWPDQWLAEERKRYAGL
jgi:hypothetical protein